MIIDIVRSNFKIIIFGFVFTLFSSVGQSYFIGLFNYSIREELNISHGDFGNLYAIATLCSSLALIWVGKKIDDIKLVNFSVFVVIFLSFAALFFSFVKSIIFLLVGIFFLRLAGQGLMAHTATTSISRYFSERRGKALSIIWLGVSSAEFLLPVIIVFLLSIFEWRLIWIGISIVTFFVLPVFSYYMVRNINIFSREKYNDFKENILIKNWTRNEVILDIKFYTILPAFLGPPAIITGLFVYQSFITESKLWGMYVLPSSFMIYSIISVISLFVSGFLVDKFTSAKIIPFLNLPLLIALLVLVIFNNQFSAYIFMFFVGLTNGLANVLGSSIWAEIYGVKNIGSIKALTTALMVFATAFGTALFGILIDMGLTIESISIVSGTYIFISIIMLFIIKGKLNPIYQQK